MLLPSPSRALAPSRAAPRIPHRRRRRRLPSLRATWASEKLTPEAEGLLSALGRRDATGHPALVVAQTAPAVRVALSEAFDRPPGAFTPGQMVASLRALGVDKVYDTNTAADLCVVEEGAELLRRLRQAGPSHDEKGEAANDRDDAGPLPMFTSCCPGWIQLVEKTMPDLWPYVSSCKSPHMMLGALLKRVAIAERAVEREEEEAARADRGEEADEGKKTPKEKKPSSSSNDDSYPSDPSDVFLVSVMPCVRKKGESMRPEYVINGVRDVDEVITTRDLAALLRAKRVDPASLDPDASFDAPFGRGSGAGQLFGVTGGVMEAAVRTVYAIVTGGETMPRLELEPVRGLEGLKEATVRLPLGDDGGGGGGRRRDLRVAVVHGLADAKTLIADMRDGKRAYDFVEVMACPGGCIGGGGQPKPPRGTDPKAVLRERADAVYALDAGAPVRLSHENPAVREAYARWLGPEVGSARALETLHVERPRGGDEPSAPPPFPPSPCGVECDACGLRFASGDDDEG